ncbi:MAG: PilZ domain-containing protein [Terriglobia bacterium]
MAPSSVFLKQDLLSGRRFERVPIHVPAVMVVKAGNGESIFRGTAIDTSEHGVRIETSFTSLTSGQTVEVVLMGDLQRALRCRVVWVQQKHAEHYGHLGLEFVSPVLAQS